MPKRIISVASGKGGVGKTTLAVNYALSLSKLGSTVLVDLDSGTSSVRNTIDVHVEKDLYHFKKKGIPLPQLITRLDTKLDPQGRYKNFGFIASPKYFIDEIANPNERFRLQLGAAINELPVDYVVLDLRAGLDHNVLDFLPYTNTSILIFTPYHPAATIAASDIVKAILFRSLRILFGKESTFFSLPGMSKFYEFINSLLDRVEDVYDTSIKNLDDFVIQLRETLGNHPIVETISETLATFHVHYVLNMFDGSDANYKKALVPFIKNLVDNVSSNLVIRQLGWIIQDQSIHDANCKRIPVLLEYARKKRKKEDDVETYLNRLTAEVGVSKKEVVKKQRRSTLESFKIKRSSDILRAQLSSLKSLYTTQGARKVQANFAYLVYETSRLMAPTVPKHIFGLTRLATPEQLLEWYMSRGLY